MNIKLTNGKKTITRTKEQYEANINHFIKRGFTPLDNAGVIIAIVIIISLVG